MRKLILLFLFLNIFNNPTQGQIPDEAFRFTEQAMYKLNMNTVRIILVEIENDNKRNAFVTANDKLTVFAIHLNKHIDRDIELVLSHELVHIQQLLDGRIKVYDNYVEWNGQKYHPNQHKHRETPWEQEAFRNEIKIKNIVTN